jgi:hypothetical protein
MDSQTFDSLVKTLASPTSRRRMVKGAAVAGLGSLLALGGHRATEAARQRCKALECPSGWKCCPGGPPECVPNGKRCT